MTVDGGSAAAGGNSERVERDDDEETVTTTAATVADEEGAAAKPGPAETAAATATPATTSTGEPLRLVTCTQSSLIDPLEVHVEERPVHVAEPVLTPIGTLQIFFFRFSRFAIIGIFSRDC